MPKRRSLHDEARMAFTNLHMLADGLHDVHEVEHFRELVRTVIVPRLDRACRVLDAAIKSGALKRKRIVVNKE